MKMKPLWLLIALALLQIAYCRWRRTMWRADLVGMMLWFGYVRWWQWRYAWQWSGEECWLGYYEDGLSPFAAIMEDASYG